MVLFCGEPLPCGQQELTTRWETTLEVKALQGQADGDMVPELGLVAQAHNLSYSYLGIGGRRIPSSKAD